MTQTDERHACSVQPQRLRRKHSQARWVAVCTVCGPIDKPYENEETAKRRAILHAESWAKLNHLYITF
jgi:hypothetical protein